MAVLKMVAPGDSGEGKCKQNLPAQYMFWVKNSIGCIHRIWYVYYSANYIQDPSPLASLILLGLIRYILDGVPEQGQNGNTRS